MKSMRILLFAILTAGFITACNQSEKKAEQEQTLEQQVNSLVEEARFEDAMAILDGRPTSPEVVALKENVHLQHGIYLIYNSDPSQMRENANNALLEFIAVLEINPENEKAIAETEQILGIYRTFPDRSPEPEIIEKLKELGFDI
jgi:PBP1b-binding outer membrane lipoprotein LpoB